MFVLICFRVGLLVFMFRIDYRIDYRIDLSCYVFVLKPRIYLRSDIVLFFSYRCVRDIFRIYFRIDRFVSVCS